MPKTLYVTDLDGTLLLPGISISPYTAAVVNGFIARGGLFTYATARSYTSASVVTQPIRWQIPAITFTGTFLVDPQTGTPLHGCTLPKDAVAPLLNSIMACGLEPLVYAFINGRERVSFLSPATNEGVLRYAHQRAGDPRLRPVQNAGSLLDGEVFYITMISEQSPIERAEAAIADIHSIKIHKLEDTYTRGEFWLEVSSPQAGKDQAILRLKEKLGASRIVVFGDNLNDLSMFKIADESYAVANAQPALKALATGIIDPNTLDGVARFLSTRI